MNYTQQTQDWLVDDMDYMNLEGNAQVEIAASEYIPESVVDSEATISVAEADRLKEFGDEINDLYDIDLSMDKEQGKEQDEEQDAEQNKEQSIEEDIDLVLKQEDESSENDDHEQEEKDEEMITPTTDNMDISETDDESITSSSQDGSDSGIPFHVDPQTGLPVLYPGSNLLSEARDAANLSGSGEEVENNGNGNNGGIVNGGNGMGSNAANSSGSGQGVEDNGNGNIRGIVNGGNGMRSNAADLEALSQGVPGGVVVGEQANLFLTASQLSDCPPGFGRRRSRGRIMNCFGIVLFVTLFLLFLQLDLLCTHRTRYK